MIRNGRNPSITKESSQSTITEIMMATNMLMTVSMSVPNSIPVAYNNNSTDNSHRTEPLYSNTLK